MFPYFIWKGKNSVDMGVIVSEYPPITRPKERVTQKTVPGMAGNLTFVESDAMPIYESYLRTLYCYIRPGADKEKIMAWLTGGGQAVFGNEPERAYTARIINQIDFSKIVRGRDYYEFAIPFYCQPYKAQYPTEETITVTESGATFENPGNIPSLPKLTVYGNGAITVITLGGTAALTGIVGGIILDWQAQECTDLSGAVLQNSRVDGSNMFTVGTNTLTFLGTVSSIVVQPNWRWV